MLAGSWQAMTNLDPGQAPATHTAQPAYNLDDSEFEAWHSDNESDAWDSVHDF